MKINSSIFHAYDIRGLYPEEINLETAYRLGAAFAKYLKDDRKNTLPFSVVVGMDMRGSSPFLARELIRGLNEQGIDVVEVGKISTPAFYYAVAVNKFPAGVIVTASHMTKEYNGFKMCLEEGAPLGRGEGQERVKEYFEKQEFAVVRPLGKLSSLPGVTDEFVKHQLSFVDTAKIKAYKIAADPANCMGATYLEAMFGEVACSPIRINWELNGNMPIHEANPIKPETLGQLQEIIRNEKADIGIATDGDGDRIGILDEQSVPIPNDILMGVVALELLKKNPGATFVYDTRFSRAVKEMIHKAGGKAVECRVGYSFAKEQIKKHQALFAGELSGHFYFQGNYNNESPVFVAGMILQIMSESEKPLSQIWRQHKLYFHSGEINFEVADKIAVMAELEKKYADGKIVKVDGITVNYPDWWFNVRPSANDPVLRLTLEADTEEKMKQKVEEVKKIIESK